MPNFCKLGYLLIDDRKLTTNEINTIQRRNLETAPRENKEKVLVLQNDFPKNLK